MDQNNSKPSKNPSVMLIFVVGDRRYRVL